MTQKKYLRLMLILGLIAVSLGGFLLHARVHPITMKLFGFVPFFAGLISIVAVSTMFFFKKLIPFAYLINGMLVIIGTVTMAHFSLVILPKNFNILSVFTGTLLADIFILWTAFFLGKLIFDLEHTTANNMDSPRPRGRFLRYPNMGYWLVHTAALGLVYSLGQMLWK